MIETPTQPARLTAKQLAALVTQACDLDRQIATQTETLKGLKKQLAFAADTKPDLQVATEGGGWSLTLDGTDGNIARITQPAPKLASSIDGEKPAGTKLLSLVGKHKDRLFTPQLKYIPVANYREAVAELFSGAIARKILSLSETESSPSVSFETKDAIPRNADTPVRH